MITGRDQPLRFLPGFRSEGHYARDYVVVRVRYGVAWYVSILTGLGQVGRERTRCHSEHPLEWRSAVDTEPKKCVH